jgi:hypothetical protein
MNHHTPQKSGHRLLPGAVAWLLLAVTGTVVMTGYSNTAGPASDTVPPLAEHLSARMTAGRHTLFMFVQPKCPCSRASISELARLMNACHEHLDAQAYFFQPADQPNNWSHTGLWESTARIPGVTVTQDLDGSHARSLHIGTSGEVLLYDPQGDLVFHGGITSSRGHEGDNIGRIAIEQIVLQQRSDHSATPVFGCSILDPQLACSAADKERTE